MHAPDTRSVNLKTPLYNPVRSNSQYDMNGSEDFLSSLSVSEIIDLGTSMSGVGGCCPEWGVLSSGVGGCCLGWEDAVRHGRTLIKALAMARATRGLIRKERQNWSVINYGGLRQMGKQRGAADLLLLDGRELPIWFST